MDPPTRPRNPQQEITPEEWSRHSDTIKTLFLTDGKSLSAVKSIMETDHDFRATVPQYKRKTKAWKIEKNLPRRKALPMISIQERRLAEGKETTFIFHGQPVRNEKLERSRKRFEKELADQVMSPVASTPSDVEYLTPRPEFDANSPRQICASIDSVIKVDVEKSSSESTVDGASISQQMQLLASHSESVVLLSPSVEFQPSPTLSSGNEIDAPSLDRPGAEESLWRDPSGPPQMSQPPYPDPVPNGGKHGTPVHPPSTTPLIRVTLPPEVIAQNPPVHIATRAELHECVPEGTYLRLPGGTQSRWWFSNTPLVPNSKDIRQKVLEEFVEEFARDLAEDENMPIDENIHQLVKLVDLGNVFAELGQTHEALQHYRHAAEELEKTLGNDCHPLPTIFTNMAVVYYEQGDYETSLEGYNRALLGYEKSHNRYNPLRMANTLGNMGYIASSQGDDGNAIEYYDRALARYENLEGVEAVVGMVDILNNVGVILHHQGDDERAIDYYNRALAQCKKFHGNRVHVNAVLNMGLLFRDQGNYEKALEWYNQALYQFERPPAGDNRHLTNVPQNMDAIAYSRRHYNDTKPLTESSRGHPQEYRNRIRLISQNLKEAMLALLSKQRNNSFFGNDDLGYYGY